MQAIVMVPGFSPLCKCRICALLKESDKVIVVFQGEEGGLQLYRWHPLLYACGQVEGSGAGHNACAFVDIADKGGISRKGYRNVADMQML